jgi:hypothetical protein
MHDKDIAIFAEDAGKFVAAFASIISFSAPRLYLSALPFAPTQSRISQTFCRNFRKHFRYRLAKLLNGAGPF